MRRRFLILVIWGLLFPAASWALGLEVNPPEIVLKDCPVGQKVALSALGGEKMKLRIQNKDSVAYTYTINVLLPAEAGDVLREGYAAIPDTSWITAENKEVRVPAKSAKAIELYLNIPKLKKYSAQKYQAVIEVKGKKNRPEDVFVLAVQIELRFSTKRELPLMKEGANLRE